MRHRHGRLRWVAWWALPAAGAILLTGCGGRTGPTHAPPVGAAATSAKGEHNATDVMFLQMMIAREQETALLTDRAAAAVGQGQGHALPAQVATLAAAIASTQADEATTMTGWLQSWRQPTTMSGDPSVHAQHGGSTALDPADLTALDHATGSDYTERFLSLLIAQQHNAVELAAMETQTGVHDPARELARRITESRNAEIAQMLTLVAAPDV
jgi:uncharacterized protein (DUF305 family)